MNRLSNPRRRKLYGIPAPDRSGVIYFDAVAVESRRDFSRLPSSSDSMTVTSRKRKMVSHRRKRFNSLLFLSAFATITIDLLIMSPASAQSAGGAYDELFRTSRFFTNSDFLGDITFNDNGKFIDLPWISFELFETNGVLSDSALASLSSGVHTFLDTELIALHQRGGDGYPFTYESIEVDVTSQDTIVRENRRQVAAVVLEEEGYENRGAEARIKDHARSHMSRSRSDTLEDDALRRNKSLRRRRNLATTTGTAVTFASSVFYDTVPGPDEDQVTGWVQSIVDNNLDQLMNNITATGHAELQNIHTASIADARSEVPSVLPSSQPTSQPSVSPTGQPSMQPSAKPSLSPSLVPTSRPSALPSVLSSTVPSAEPSESPSLKHSMLPTLQPSDSPSLHHSAVPSAEHSAMPTLEHSMVPSLEHSAVPSLEHSAMPSSEHSAMPSLEHSAVPSSAHSTLPSSEHSMVPSSEHSMVPSSEHSVMPSSEHSVMPSSKHSTMPSSEHSASPSSEHSMVPSSEHSAMPSTEHIASPSSEHSAMPTSEHSVSPSSEHSVMPSLQHSASPSVLLSTSPSSQLDVSQPSISPSLRPSSQPVAILVLPPFVNTPSLDQASSIPSFSPSQLGSRTMGVMGETSSIIQNAIEDGNSNSIVIATSALVGAVFIALGSILYIRRLKHCTNGSDDMSEKKLGVGMKKFRSFNAYEDLESDIGSDHKSRSPTASNAAAKRWFPEEEEDSIQERSLGAQFDAATRKSLEAESISSNSSVMSDMYASTPERSPIHVSTGPDTGSDQAIEVSLSPTYESPERERTFMTPLMVAKNWLSRGGSSSGNKVDDTGSSSNGTAQRSPPEPGSFNFTSATDATSSTGRGTKTSPSSESNIVGGTVGGQESSVSSLTQHTLNSSIFTRIGKFTPTSAYGLSVAELNQEGTEAFDLCSSFGLSSESSEFEVVGSTLGGQEFFEKEEEAVAAMAESPSHLKELARVSGKPPIPMSDTARSFNFDSEMDSGPTPVKRNGVGRFDLTKKGTIQGKLSQEEFEATWDVNLPFGWDPVKDNPNAVVKGGVVSANSSPERLKSLVGSLGQNGEVHFQKNQVQRRPGDGSLRIGTSEGETEGATTHHEITPVSMKTDASPLSADLSMIQDGSFPKFEMVNGDDTNLLPPRPIVSSGTTTGDESSAFHTAITRTESDDMHPLDWSNRASEFEPSDTSTLSENGHRSIPTNEDRIVWGDHHYNSQRRRYQTSRSSQSRSTYGHTEDDMLTPRTYGDTTNTETFEGASYSSSHASSKQLINDLVWLERKIADVRSAALLEQCDTISYDSHFCPSDTDDESLASNVPMMQSIVCRDCYAPPGKLQIVILSTKDGPAVHTVKNGSSLEGQMFPGDLIIAVDNVDTRSFTAEHVMMVMQAKSDFQRKITVLHFEDAD